MKLQRQRRAFSETVLRFLVPFAAFLTIAVLMCIIFFILIKGLPNLKPSLFFLRYTSENVSLLPALLSTIVVTFLSLLIAAPLGIFSAIYLTEYAKRGSRIVSVIRLTVETLQGIPSIVYGLFGLLLFVTRLKLGFSVLAGALTLSIMILPLILRSTEEAIISVPNVLRESALGLGTGKLRTIFKIVLPAASPGIFAGVVLAIGRIVGETAALIYTAGTAAQIPLSPLQSARTLSVHMYALSGEGLHTKEAFASAAVLLVLVTGLNTLSAFIVRRLKSA